MASNSYLTLVDQGPNVIKFVNLLIISILFWCYLKLLLSRDTRSTELLCICSGGWKLLRRVSKCVVYKLLEAATSSDSRC